MNASRDPLPAERFLHFEKTTPDNVYLRQPQGPGNYREFTWGEVGDQVRRMATALKSLGLQRGDKVAIAARNSAHWIMADQAISSAGMVSVGLYPKQSTDGVRYVLEHSETKAIFLGPILGQDGIVAGIPEQVIKIRLPYADAPPAEHEWDELIASNARQEEDFLPKPDDLWTLVYTSGTTGLPKGVALSHANAAFGGKRAADAFGMQADEHFFSYLPLAHIAERGVVEGMSLYAGGQISFLENIERFAQQLGEVAPTRFFAVPLVWNKLRAGILAKKSQAQLDRLLRIPLLGRFVAGKIRKALGLQRCRSAFSGAAPLPDELGRWFARLGIEVLQGYGMTENSAYATANRPGRNRPGSVGQAMPDCDLKIAENGEILTRSGATMMAYYKDPEKTAETVTDGWLHTGDKGRIDADGYLYITGRVKDIFKTLKGKYVAPAPIEGEYAVNPAIDQICVLGDGLKQPVAVLVLAPESRGQDWAGLKAELLENLETINAKLEPHERLSHLFVTDDEWSPDNGLVTPTMKVRRDAVEARYLPLLEGLLGPDDLVIKLAAVADS